MRFLFERLHNFRESLEIGVFQTLRDATFEVDEMTIDPACQRASFRR